MTYTIEVLGADPYGRWPRTRTGDHVMALRTALCFVREMERELGSALPIIVTGPDYNGAPISADEIRSLLYLFGGDGDRRLLHSN